MNKLLLGFFLVLLASTAVGAKTKKKATTMKFTTSCGTVTYSDTRFFDSVEEMQELMERIEAADCGK